MGVAIDPLTSHECGNQRYLAIPWLDACLAARLSNDGGATLRPMPAGEVWLAPIEGGTAVPTAAHAGDPLGAGWLPNEALARAWMQYVKGSTVADDSPPPAPRQASGTLAPRTVTAAESVDGASVFRRWLPLCCGRDVDFKGKWPDV